MKGKWTKHERSYSAANDAAGVPLHEAAGMNRASAKQMIELLLALDGPLNNAAELTA